MSRFLYAALLIALAAAVLHVTGTQNASLAQEEWHGIRVAAENRCAPYDRDDYPYSQSVELAIIAREGGSICSPYTNECFNSRFDTDIEHIVAVSEAHDSGLCAVSNAIKRQFSSDLRNLTLASPGLNRNQKRAKDAADWMPAQNRCWFANQIITVRRAYNLTIDRREANALDGVLATCDVTVPADTTVDQPTETVRVVTHSGTVNARACADTACEIVTTFSSGQALDVIEQVEGAAWSDDTRWLKVRHGDAEVFVHASLAGMVTPTPTPVPTATPSSGSAPTVNINQATTTYYVIAPVSANARSCPRTTCNVVTSLARGAAVNVLQRVSGESVSGNAFWQAVKHNSAVVYVHAPLLSQTRPRPTSTPAPRPVTRSQQPAPQQQQQQPAQVSVPPTAVQGPQFSCNCSKTCGAMASCQEAYFQLNQCGCSRRDSDSDGVPCESICPGG